MNLPLIFGRDAELEQLRKLLSRRHSFLLYGPAGAGKTLLLTTLIKDFFGALYCKDSSGSQIVFRTLAAELFAEKNHRVLQACGKSGLAAIKDKSAVSIRGIVIEALREASYWIVLDHLQCPSQSFATALKDLCSGTTTPLVAAARSAHMEDVGFLLPMFPDRPDRFALQNFDSGTARQFALQTARQMKLDAANQEKSSTRLCITARGIRARFAPCLRWRPTQSTSRNSR
jgi:DNA polymerase III delta prime subunit